ncbi:MAG: hypothetical protein Q4F17_03645 [Eubacteriales bacterium]|nr:hypothetical protein [Eubacteriales bacterium]
MDFLKFFRKKQPEFRPDPQAATWLKTARMTRQQRLRLGKWLLYAAAILLALVIQDVIMSRVRLFGATTDLAVTVILLIAVLEGTEVGSVFVLIASIVYYFTGTAPGAYCIGLLTFFGIGAALLRQMYLHRSRGAIVLCAGLAQLGYELGLYGLGIFMGLTRWDRLGAFALTGLLGLLVMIPLYPLIVKIGLIGGNTWKE